MPLHLRLWIAALLLGLAAGCSESAEDKLRREYEACKAKAEQGSAEEQHNLAVLYYEGKGVLPSFVKAMFWHQKAAEQGLAMSQNQLGYILLMGVGVLKDEEQAVSWFKKQPIKALPGHSTT